MNTQASVPAKQSIKITKTASGGDDIYAKIHELTNHIAKRAYDLFTFRGFQNGHDLEDWFAAERELLQPTRLEIKDNEKEYFVTLDVPGFDPEDLNVQIQGNQIVVSGEQHKETKRTEDKGKTIYSEKTAKQIYRAFQLPTPALADKAVATLNKGVLELRLPKAAIPAAIPIKAA